MKYIVYIIIGTVLFLVFRKIIRRLFPKLKTGNNVMSGILAIGLSPLVTKALFILIFNIILFEYHPARTFKADSWKENVEDRHQMSDDLIHSKILMDKTKEQIADKIGLPINNISLKQDTLTRWKYSMGSRGWGFGFKFYDLQIKFQNGKSVKVDIEESID